MSINHIQVADAAPLGDGGPGTRWPSFGSKRAWPARRPSRPVADGALVGGEEGRPADAGTTSRNLGPRLLRVLVLLACYFVLELAVKAVMVVQLLFVAWRKHPHAGLQRAGSMLARYMKDLWGYCTFASDRAPWPFSPWPRSQPDVSA